MWTQPGSVYGVDNKITNKGPPLADSFVLKEHIRFKSWMLNLQINTNQSLEFPQKEKEDVIL